jgi:DNA-binding MarR family transcriptional regulator
MDVTQESTLKTQVEQVSEDLSEKDGVVLRPDGLKYLSPVRAAAFLGLVRAGTVLADQLSRELETEHGLSLRDFEVLLFLAVFAPEGSLRMTQLTEHAPLSQSRVSRLVDQLETRGLVERSPDEQDRRGVAVSITPKGLEGFKAAQETHLAGLERLLFSHLGDSEIRQLAKITKKIVDACQTDHG